MKKLCKVCGVNERIYHRTICQPCKNKKQTEIRNLHKDGYFYVYMLPNTKYYVGQTNNIHTRFEDHKYKHKNDTTDYILLHKCTSRKEALWYESVYHKLGFPGEKDTINYKRYGIKKSPTKR